MAKQIPAAVTDLALNYVKDNVERLVVCTTEPANYAGVAALTLGDVSFSDTDVTGPGSGGGGRQVTFAAKEEIDADDTGTAGHVALVKDSATAQLLLVTTLATPQGVTTGNTMETASFSWTITNPT